MRKLVVLFLMTLLVSFSLSAQAWMPDTKNEMEMKVQTAILTAKKTDPGMKAWFDSAAGYAVFPDVGKGGIGIGGAHGKGLVISGDKTIGETELTQLTIGFQFGGQVYIEVIFFKDAAALAAFTRDEFELGAQVSAVALTLGASADADYKKGVAVFTIVEGGLMYEATVGGQRFEYKAK